LQPTSRGHRAQGNAEASRHRSAPERERALGDLFYEMLVLASALIFRDIRYLFSVFSKLDWNVARG
jgi:hypothetical protein